jgi:hypothetical protein
MSSNLGFSYEQIPESNIDILNSFTAEELDTLRRIYLRAKEANIDLKPKEML